MTFNTELICIDNNGNENQFLYSMEEFVEEGRIKWLFKVMPFDLQATDWYEFEVTQINNTTGKVTFMNNRNMIEYKKKGITEKLIHEVSKTLDLIIISSTNITNAKSLPNEFRSVEATKVWERLKDNGFVSHDKVTDIYTYSKKIIQ